MGIDFEVFRGYVGTNYMIVFFNYFSQVINQVYDSHMDNNFTQLHTINLSSVVFYPFLWLDCVSIAVVVKEDFLLY